MPCKLHHDDPMGVPVFLCRTCHPELIQTAEKVAAADHRDQELRALQAKRNHLAREIGKCERDIAGLTIKGEPAREPSKSILASIRKKLERLELEELTL